MMYDDSWGVRGTSASDALDSICAGLFDQDIEATGAERIEPADMPTWHRSLLVHNEHMTTQLQTAYGEPVNLHVVREELFGDSYRRLIHLTLPSTEKIVEVGICRIDFRYTPAEVRTEVLEKRAPLGDILIRHNVLRRIEPKWFWKFDNRSPVARVFGENTSNVVGRVGLIHCNGVPAIELLEVVNDARG